MGPEADGAMVVASKPQNTKDGLAILVVEPDDATANAISLELARERYRLVIVRSGQQAIDSLTIVEPALVLLELALPDMGGLALCGHIHARDNSVIILVSGSGSEAEALASFEAGADGYLTKPYRWRELTARIAAVLRRRPPSLPRDGSVLVVGDIELDPGRHEVRVGGRLVTFPLREFQLLRALLSSPGKVWTREALMQRIWGEMPPSGTKSVDVHIKRIRARIENDPSHPIRLLTVRGVGYTYASPPNRMRP
ncbi:MAG: response regulator transcription factor [Actinomycetota bacterium]|nr:response regulator transcription factor [Actinomycetota bacterium]